MCEVFLHVRNAAQERVLLSEMARKKRSLDLKPACQVPDTLILILNTTTNTFNFSLEIIFYDLHHVFLFAKSY